jgi:hypothetical protein
MRRPVTKHFVQEKPESKLVELEMESNDVEAADSNYPISITVEVFRWKNGKNMADERDRT